MIVLTFFTQTGFLGLWGESVDSIDYYKHQIEEIEKRVSCDYHFTFRLLMLYDVIFSFSPCVLVHVSSINLLLH